MPVCRSCGHDNPESSRFCASCGAALGPSQVAETPVDATSTMTIGTVPAEADEPQAGSGSVDAAALDALASGTALLVVARGPNAGSRFLLDAAVTTVGRHPESDIFLDDITVSRRHAKFERSANGFTVADVGSLNGTYVNRDRIDSVELHANDEVQIGKYRMTFHPAAPAAGGADGEGH